MNTNKIRKARLALGALLALGLAAARPAAASTTSYMDVQVNFSCNLSVQVDGAALVSSYTTTGAGASGYALPGSSATVTNNAGCTERWQLSASTYTPAGYAAQNGWQLYNATGTSHTGSASACTNSCPGAEQYGVQALFVSSTALAAYGANGCPAMNSVDWDAFVDTVPATPGWSTADTVQGPITYTGSRFADTNSINGMTGNPDSSNPNPGEMYNYVPASGVGRRALCVRVTMPSTTVIPSSVPQIIRLAITAIGG